MFFSDFATKAEEIFDFFVVMHSLATAVLT